MLLPDLGISAPSVVARIMAWARDETYFRPSRSGGATVPVAARSLQAYRRAMTHRHRRFVDFRDSVYSDFNLHPRTRMQLLSLHVNDVSDSQRFFFSKDCSHGQLGRLTCECRARATCRVHKRTRSGTSTSCNESRPLALRDEETAWSGDSEPGATNERRRHLTAIRASPKLGNPSPNQIPVCSTI